MMYYFVSSMGTVGHDRMTEEQIVDNILAAASTIEERVPGGPDNIRSILIKCTDSLSIPLHSNIGKYSGHFMPFSRGRISAPFPIENSNLFSQYHVLFPPPPPPPPKKKKNFFFFF